VDVAPTISVLLGMNIPASSEGKPLLEMLNADTTRQALIHKAWGDQQAALTFAYQSAIGVPPQAREFAQAGVVAAIDTRETMERLPRVIVAAVIALIGAGILIWRRSRDVAVLFFGAILYIVVYNLIFAVVAGNVYSMSTVPTAGATAFVVEIAEYAAIAVLLGWLAAMLLSSAFRRGALRAAQATCGFAFITIYLLALPALLGFAVNGAVTTWRLPNPLLIFLHFTNLIQAMLVAVLGIVLSGIAALVGWRAAK
jgi:hypothetical protein